MKKFSEFVIKFRLLIIILTIGITLFLGFQLKNIQINSDILSYLPKSDEAVKLFNQTGQMFGGNSLAIIAIEDNNIFNYKTLTKIKNLTDEFEKDKGISRVISLTNIIDIKKVEGGLEINDLIDSDNIPKNKEILEILRKYTLSKDMYVGNLISSNGEVTIIICRVKDDVNKVAVAKRLKNIVGKYPGPEKTYYAGVPFQMVLIQSIIISQVKKLVPLVIILIVIVLFIGFKNFRGVILPLSAGFLSTVWVFGFMIITGNAMDLVSNAIPVLLIAVGSAYGIHIMTKYYEDIRDERTKKEKIALALKEVGIPIVLAGVTTAIGFLSFLTAYITVIKSFGIFMSLGILFALIISLTFIPAVLSFLKVKERKNKDKNIENKSITKFMDHLSDFVLKNEKTIIFLTILIVLLCIIGLFHIHSEVNMMEYFDKNSEIRITERMMQKKFGGSIPIQIQVKGDIKDPYVLKEMMKIENYLKSLPDIHNPNSIADLISEMNDVMNGRYIIPDTKEGVSNLWFFLEGQDILDQMVNGDKTVAMIQANLGTIDTTKIVHLVDKINNYIKNNVKSRFIEVNLNDLKESQRNILEDKKISNTVNAVKTNISIRLPDYKFDTEKCRGIISENRESNSLSDSSVISLIQEEIKKYFSGDEADIEINSSEKIAGIVLKIGERLQKDAFSKNDIIKILNNNLSKDITEDTEGIELAAEAIESIIDDTLKKEKVEIIFNEIENLFPKEIKNNKKFNKEINDILWRINENNIALSPDEYRTVFRNNDQNRSFKAFLVKQTGLPIIYKKLDRQIIKSQIKSLVISLFLIFILLTIQLRSFAGGLTGITPIVLTILINFGVMSLFGIALDIITVLIGSVAIGIGIDYTIHFISRFKVEFKQNNSVHNALKKTLETTGVAILINALSVSMGFLVLLFGSIVPIRQFGWLMALTMITSALGAITVVPAIIIVTHASFVGNFKRFARNMANKVNEKIKNGGRKNGKN
jgi:predicted RND superfamily exporter protein